MKKFLKLLVFVCLYLGVFQCSPKINRSVLDFFSVFNGFSNLLSSKLSIGGEVNGLQGSGLRLQLETALNGSMTKEEQDVISNGRFTFQTVPLENSSYNVTILSQPTNPNQLCQIGGASGTVSNQPITNILVQCADSTLPLPEFSPPPGEFSTSVSISIFTSSTNSKIYYTTEGTNPTCLPDGSGTGVEYIGPVPLPQPSLLGIELRAIACAVGLASNVQTGIYRVTNGQLGMVTSSLPTNPPAANYTTSPQTATLSPPVAPPAGTTIHYTVDGTTPTCGSPSTPNPVNMNGSTTIRAIACAPDWSPSPVAVFPYIITGTVDTPSFSIVGGNFNNTQTVGLSVITPGASIRYATTTDGSNPVATCASTLYTAPIVVSETNTRIQAIGCLTDWTDSPVTPIQTYTLQVANPILAPAPPLAVQTTQVVSATSGTTSATFHFTTDGSVPTCASSTTSPSISADNIEADITVRVIACRTGFNSSAVASGVYTKTGTLAPPTFSPTAGSYTSTQNVTLVAGAGNPAGTEIRYRTDGSPATCSDTLYGGAISVSASQTISAISCRPTPLWNSSSSASSVYTITGTLATPTFSPTTGTYNDVLSVTITSNAGSTIYYNTAIGSDPVNPTCGSGFTAQPIPVNFSDTRIRAIACQAGWTDSLVGTATFTLRPDTPVPNFASGSIFGNTVNISFTTSIGADIRVVEGSMFTPPDDPTCGDAVTNNVTIPAYPSPALRSVKAIACRTGFASSLLFNGSYTVNGPVTAPTLVATLDSANRVTVNANTPPAMQALCYRIGADPECSATLGGAPNPLGQSCAAGSTVYNASSKPVLTGTSDFRVRACSNNHEQSTVVQNIFTISGTVGAVSATPAPGVVNNDPTITLSAVDSTAIYYRTDGTNPDCTGLGSVLYTAPFLQTPITMGNTTIKAIGCAAGRTPSAVADLSYTYQVATPTTASIAGTKTNDESVTLLNTTTGATMRYNLNSTSPADCAAGTSYGGAISLPTAAASATPGLRAIGCRTNYLPSAVLSRDYTFQTDIPDFKLKSTNESITASPYTTGAIDILLSTATTGAKICVRPGGVPSCDGITGNCGIGNTDLGATPPQVFIYQAMTNVSLAAVACKANYNQNPTVATRELVPDTSKLRLFVTANGYTGNLGGILGADDKCNTDPAKPYSNGLYRAVLMNAGQRTPPGSGALDWVLYSSTDYIRSDVNRTAIFTTGGDRSPPNTFTDRISLLSNSVWTGIQTAGAGIGPLTTGAQTCSGWTESTTAGRYGSLTNADLRALDVNSTTGFCGVTNRLLCAEGRRRIYVTNDSYLGNMGGKTGADNICNTDPGKPGIGNFKAMLRFSDRMPAAADWVFQPNTRYYRADGETLIGQTTPDKRLPATLVNSFTATNYQIRTGFANGFTASVNNCNDFTDGIDIVLLVFGGNSGNTNLETATSAFGVACNTPYRIVCVEQ